MILAPMISVLPPLILEAALRALLAAAAVWTGLQILRVSNVLAQKAAWGLVLVAALAMPLMPHWQIVPTFAALRLPTISTQAQTSQQASTPKSAALTASSTPSVPHTSTVSAWTNTPQRHHSATTKMRTSQPSSPAADRDLAPAISSADFPPVPQMTSNFAPSMSQPPASTQTAVVNPTSSPIQLPALAWLLYLGVFAALVVRLLFGLASALRLWISANPVSTSQEAAPLNGIAVRSSSRVASPVNIGSGIILPDDFADWDAEKLRVVLAHERSHIRQGDFYLQLLAGLYASLFWFSPLGWWLKRKLSELSEAISDRAGLEEAASRSSYAQLLLEFAALPRPTLTGVAMARTSHLTQRIERLLNESSFRQAFATGGRRARVAVLLVPVALLAATALVRVEAAATTTQAASQTSLAGQSAPEQVTDQAAPAPAPAPEAAPAPTPSPAQEPSPAAMPAPPAPPAGADEAGPAPMAPRAPNSGTNAALPAPPAMGAMPEMPPMPPMPKINVRIPRDAIRIQIDPEIRTEIAEARQEANRYRGFNYTGDGEPYALVGDPGSKTRFNGDWDGGRREEIEKARKIAHGHFLWFRHADKSYIVDDPAIVSQIEALNKPMDEIGAKMRALGEQMRDLGKQQRDMGKQMRDVTIPTPDLSKEMAELNTAIASLKAKQGGTITQKDLGDLQREIGRIQGELGSLQGKIVVQQMNLNGGMGKFGEEQGKLGAQMGELGAQMGHVARENHEQINQIIDESLKNGKARPVE